jgi:hypothetical protein
MPGDELSRIDEWLTATLLADAAVTAIVGQRVYGELAPPSSSWPHVLFQQQASSDVMGAAQNRIMVDAVYLVRGVHEAESFGGAVKALADAITAALHAEAGATTDALILACTRARPFRLVELDNGGAQYRHAGSIFRILAQLS